MLKNKKILVVEDNMLFSMILETMLDQMEIECVGVCSTEKEALQKFHQAKPDIILMDILLDGKDDGLKIAKEIKSFSDPHIIFITAADFSKEKLHSMKQKGDVLKKPFTFEEFYSALNKSSEL
jgi:DNA-binding response OmpR family regulator